jgi:hypothetical protein
MIKAIYELCYEAASEVVERNCKELSQPNSKSSAKQGAQRLSFLSAMRLLVVAACCLAACNALGPYLYSEDVLQVRKSAMS